MFFYNEFKFLFPSIFLAIAIIFTFMYWIIVNNSITSKNNNKLFSTIGASILVIELIILIYTNIFWNNSISVISDIFYIDSFINNFKILLIFFGFISLFYNINYSIKKNEEYFEQPLLFLLAILGMILMIESNDFISFYLSFELQSFVLYILASSDYKSKNSTEAGLKYFILGSFSSAFILFGISLIYLYTGSTNFQTISWLLADGGHQIINIGIIVGLVLILTGLLFKLPAAPFHNWAPDVYHGAPLHVTAFFSIVPKFAILGVLIRLLYSIFPTLYMEWNYILLYSSVLSILIGAMGALNQINIKRLLAYSTIGHVGFILLSLSARSLEGLFACCVYLIVYSILSVNFFTILFILYHYYGNEPIFLADLEIILKDHPIIGVLLSLNLFSLAGVPPLAGFFSKFYVLVSTIKADFYFTSFVIVLISVLSAFYYIRVIRIIFFGTDKTFFKSKQFTAIVRNISLHRQTKIPLSFTIILSLTSIFNAILILYPQPLFLFCHNMASQFFIN